MRRQAHGTDDPLINADELVREIEQNTPDAVTRARAHARFSVRTTVFVEEASMSHRSGTKLQGVTGDISAGGAQILTPRPLRINDMYLISFDRESVDIPPAYALCVRARLVRADAFEAGVKFISPVVLPTGPSEEQPPDSLI